MSPFPHVGKMDFVDNRVDPATGTIRGRALVPNPAGSSPWAVRRLQLLGSGEFEALLVPDSAILSDQSRRFVSGRARTTSRSSASWSRAISSEACASSAPACSATIAS